MSRSRWNFLLLGSLSFPWLIGCTEETVTTSVPPVKTADDSVATAKPSDESPGTAPSERQGFDGLEFLVPEGWKKVPLSQFQMGIISAKFEIPEAGPDVTLTLSRSGGGVAANLDRWRGQFSQTRPEVTDTISVAGTDASLIDLEGRFSAGFGRDPMDGWRMIGVIAPISEQSYFMKLTGPVAEVEAAREAFLTFAGSAVRE